MEKFGSRGEALPRATLCRGLMCPELIGCFLSRDLPVAFVNDEYSGCWITRVRVRRHECYDCDCAVKISSF